MSSLSFLQITLALIAVFFLMSGLLKFVKRVKSQTLFKLLMTCIIWGNILFFSLLPRTAQDLSTMLGLGKNLNTLIFIGFVIVFAIIFKLLAIIEKLERNISEIVRKEALEKLSEQKE